MKIRKTQSYDFDPLYVLTLIDKNKLTIKDYKCILDSACKVIFGLRKDLSDILFKMEELIETRQYWLNKK